MNDDGATMSLKREGCFYAKRPLPRYGDLGDGGLLLLRPTMTGCSLGNGSGV